MTDIEKELRNILTGYYNSDKEAEEWLNRPFKLMSSEYAKTPKELIERGRGEELLTFIRNVLR